MPEETIKTLNHAARIKFDEICDFLADLHELDSNPENLSDEQNDQLVGEAKELIEKSDPFGQHTIVGLPDKLERLLTQYHKICERRRGRWKAARERLVERGVLVDSGEKKMDPDTKKLEIAWMLNSKLPKTQQDALVEFDLDGRVLLDIFRQHARRHLH
jgi:hypothetical protein